MCFSKHQSFLFKRLKRFRNEKVFIGMDSLLTMITNFWKPFSIFIHFLRIWKMCRYKMNGHMHDGMQCERKLEKIISFYLWKHGLQYDVWIMHVKWCALLIINSCNHEDDACGMMCSHPLSVYSIMCMMHMRWCAPTYY